MSLPFTPEEFFNVFAAYNAVFWPAALTLWLGTTWVFLGCVRGRPPRSPFIVGLLTFHWAWAAVAYHAVLFSTINPAAWLFSGLFLVEAVLLAWLGLVRHRLRFAGEPSSRALTSAVLIAYALLYPFIARAEGHAYPQLPTFGVPCPTTILTIGFLLAMAPPLPLVVTIIPILWACIAGSAALLLGMRTDLMLFVAAIVLVVDVCVVRPRHLVGPLRRSLPVRPPAGR